MKDKKVKDFDTVKNLREPNDTSKDIQGMNFGELTAYLAKTKLRPPDL